MEIVSRFFRKYEFPALKNTLKIKLFAQRKTGTTTFINAIIGFASSKVGKDY